DLDAAFGRVDEEGFLLATVERYREVVLLVDLRRALDPDLRDDVTSNVEPDYLRRLVLGVVRILGELDAAGLAASARQHLRLHDDTSAELLRRRARLGSGCREPTVRDRDPEAPTELLSLVLVEVHAG